MKIRFWIVVFAIAVIGASDVHAATLPFDSKSQVQVKIQESEWFNYPSHLAQRNVYNPETDDHDSIDCPNWGKGDCGVVPAGSRVSYFGTLVFPMCDVRNADFCIEKLEVKNETGEWRTAQFERSISGPTHIAVPEIGYPTAGTVSLFGSMAEDKTLGVDGYAVYASVEMRLDPSQSPEASFSSLDLRVTPYKETSGNFTEQSISASTSTKGRKSIGFTTFGEENAWSENGRAGKALQFNEKSAIRLTTHIPASVTGWLGGRLSHAEFEVTSLSKNVNRLVIGGNPVKVGRAVANFERSNPPELFKQNIINSPSSSSFGWRGSNGVFQVLDAIKTLMSDKSVFEEVRWAVESFPNSTQFCLNDSTKLVGLVTSNATVFYSKPPIFSNGSLNYQVGGLHYESNGAITSGQYDLVMRSDVARCLYKYSSAPIQGSISITYESGSSEVATQVVNESNGWLHLGAYNFTYSSPVISVKLLQNSPEVTPSSQPTSKPTSSKTAISCVKGKLIKKVVAINPKCPKGYKKK